MSPYAYVPIDWVSPCRVSNVNSDAMIFVGFPHSAPVLVLETEEYGPLKIYLGKSEKFQVISPDIADGLAGGAIIGISIEFGIDQISSIIDESEIIGSFVKDAGKLSFFAKGGVRGMVFPHRVTIKSGLECHTQFERIAFPNWRIVKNNGDEKIVLWSTNED